MQSVWWVKMSKVSEETLGGDGYGFVPAISLLRVVDVALLQGPTAQELAGNYTYVLSP